MKYALAPLMSAVLLCLSIQAPVSADGPTCYVCSESQCWESELSGFAARECEFRCFTAGGFPFCLCRTYGDTCLRAPDGSFSDPLHPEYVYSMDVRLHESLMDLLPLEVEKLFDQSLQRSYLGESQGDAYSQGGDLLYSYKALAEITADGIYHHVALKDHAEIEEVEATFYDGGRRALVVITRHRQKPETVELFSD